MPHKEYPQPHSSLAKGRGGTETEAAWPHRTNISDVPSVPRKLSGSERSMEIGVVVGETGYTIGLSL